MSARLPIGLLALHPGPQVGEGLLATHRNAVAGPARYVPPSGSRGAETVLGMTSGTSAYHLFLDSQTGTVTTDLGAKSQRRPLLLEEWTALRPALEKLAARTDALLNGPLSGWVQTALRRDPELLLSRATAHRLLQRF